MKNILLLLFFATVIFSCKKDEEIQQKESSVKFNLHLMESSSFTSYCSAIYDGENPQQTYEDTSSIYYWTKDTFQLSIDNNLEVDGQLYSGYYASGDDRDMNMNILINRNTGYFQYVLNPIRFENGKYYELRNKNELMILKDDIVVGEKWNGTISSSKNAFEVVAFYERFTSFGLNHENVFKVKETIYYGKNRTYVAQIYSYYNESGLIRREVPSPYNFTYLTTIFNRL